MNFSRFATALLLVCVSLLGSALPSSALGSEIQQDAYGEYYARDSYLYWREYFNGAYYPGNRTSPYDGFVGPFWFSNPPTLSCGSLPARLGVGSISGCVLTTATTNVGNGCGNSNDEFACMGWNIPSVYYFHFSGTANPATSLTYYYQYNYSRSCSLTAPLIIGGVCSCPGTVSNGKCRPAAEYNPCTNAPGSVTLAEPAVPAYNSQGLPMGGNESCAATPGCSLYASWCETEVDVPNLGGVGCAYTPSNWTRAYLGTIDLYWRPVYTKTGSTCATSEAGEPPAPLPEDADSDGTPDASDPDNNNNGTPDAEEPDFDGDGSPDSSDPDDDNDGSPDTSDPSPLDPGVTGPPTGPGDGGGTCDPAVEECGTGGCTPETSVGCGDRPGSGFYSPTYAGGIVGVYNARKSELLSTPLLAGVSALFTVDFAGSCPVWSFDALGQTYFIDLQCSPQFDYVWLMVAGILLILATKRAVYIALDH